MPQVFKDTHDHSSSKLRQSIRFRLPETQQQVPEAQEKANVLARNLEEAQPVITQYKYNPAWQSVWIKIASLLKDNDKDISRFFDLLLAKPRDLYGLYEVSLLAQCLEACDLGAQLKTKTRQDLLTYIKGWVNLSLQQRQSMVIEVLWKLPNLFKALEIEAVFLAYVSQPDLARENRMFAYTLLGEWPEPRLEVAEALLLAGEHTDFTVRKAAWDALPKLKFPWDRQDEIINILLAKAKHANYGVRKAALSALGSILNCLASEGDKVPYKGVEALLNGMKDENSEVRKVVLSTLGSIPNLESEAIKALLDGMRDENSEVRKAAQAALEKLPNPSPRGVEALLAVIEEDDNNGVQEAALSALEHVSNPSDEVIEVLLIGTKSKNYDVRRAVLSALGQVSNPSDEVVEAVLNSAKHNHYYVYKAGQDALEKLRNLCNEKAVRLLLDSAKDKNYDVRRAVLNALGQVSNPSDEVVEALLDGAKDKNYDVRRAALSALGQIPNLNHKIVEALLDGAKVSNELILKTVRDALEKLSNPSTGVVKVLLNGTKDENSYVRKVARSALEKLSNPSIRVVKVLLKGAKDKNSYVRLAALCALGQVLNPSDEVIDALLTGARDENNDVRIAVLRVLGRMPDTNPKVTQTLLDSVEDKDEDVSKAAQGALKSFKPNKNTVQTLVKGMQNRSQMIRRASLYILGQMSDSSAEVIPENTFEGILQALLDNTKEVARDDRIAALRALKNVKNRDTDVIPALLDGMKDKNKDAREAARASLRSILNLQTPLDLAPVLVNALHDLHDMIELIPLPHLIQAYPSWIMHQGQARLALQYQLKQAGTAIVKLNDKQYQCIINGKEFPLICANPSQLKSDLKRIRWVPMVLKPPSIPFQMFKPAISADTSVTVSQNKDHNINNKVLVI